MNERKLPGGSIGGAPVVVACGFTPILVWTLGRVGLGAPIAGLDDVFWPALPGFVGPTISGLSCQGRALAARAESR
jgi:hypothetical protein